MSPAKKPGVILMAIAFAVFFAIVIGTTVWGDKANTLHTSAQAWAFVGVFGILAAFGAPGLVEMWAKKPT